MYAIGEISKISGISINTLRFYDKEGILQPILRNKNTGYRYYSEEQLVEIQLIKNMKMIGLSLSDIRDVIHKKNIAYTHKKINHAMTIVEEKLQALRNIHEYMSQSTYLLQLFLEEGKEGLHQHYPITTKEVLEEKVLPLKATWKNQEDFTKSCTEIQKQRDNLGLIQKGPLRLYFSKWNPDTLLHIGKEVKLAIPLETASNNKNTFPTIPATRVASMITTGTAWDILPTYEKLVSWIKENNYMVKGAPFMDFLLEPCDSPEADQYIVEFFIPVKEKQESTGKTS